MVFFGFFFVLSLFFFSSPTGRVGHILAVLCMQSGGRADFSPGRGVQPRAGWTGRGGSSVPGKDRRASSLGTQHGHPQGDSSGHPWGFTAKIKVASRARCLSVGWVVGLGGITALGEGA